MRIKSDNTIQSNVKYITFSRFNQLPRTDKEIRENISLLKTYYAREREATETRSNYAKRLVYGMTLYKNKTPLQIERETGIPRQTVYKYLKQLKGGDSK